MATETKTSLYTALLAVQAEAPAIQKTKINPAFKSKYVSLDVLMESVMPILSKHGLVWVTRPVYRGSEDTPVLHYSLIHAESQQSLDGEMLLMLAKNDPQGQGSAITYARRYSLMAVLGLVADEDDDGNKASRPRPDALTDADRAELRAAAKGLKVAQIKMALTSVGIAYPANGALFELVPKAKVVLLCEALSGMEREK